jgi:hypothetical protein
MATADYFETSVFILEMATADYFQMSVFIYQSKRHHVAEDSIFEHEFVTKPYKCSGDPGDLWCKEIIVR